MSSAVKYQRTLFEPEHELFRESYRAFLDRHVAPYHDEWEKAKIVDRGDLVARVHADGRVQQAEHNSDGTRIKARVPVALAASLREFSAR